MDIITPGLGLIFWTTLFFLIAFIILGKKVFPEILKALKTREDSIDKALKDAEKARQDITGLQGQIEQMKQEARKEREEIINDAKVSAKQIIAEAQEEAKVEAVRMVEQAKEAINAEKREAMASVKNQVAELSLEIAEKVIRQNLDTDASQKQLVKELLEVK